MNMRPFDDTLYMQGWFDFHHAGGPATWNESLYRGPDNYYAVRAAARLDTIPWPALDPVTEAPPDSLDGIFDRAHRLDVMGMDMEAKFERDRVAADDRREGRCGIV